MKKFAVLFILSFMFVNCGDDNSRVCAPDDFNSCTCKNDLEGKRYCDTSGDFWGECVCDIPDCGNGKMNPGEMCETAFEMNQVSCRELGLYDGIAFCKDDCSGWNTSQCATEAVCGNHILEDDEVCEQGDLQSCEAWNFTTGYAICYSDCSGWNKIDCARNETTMDFTCHDKCLNPETPYPYIVFYEYNGFLDEYTQISEPGPIWGVSDYVIKCGVGRKVCYGGWVSVHPNTDTIFGCGLDCQFPKPSACLTCEKNSAVNEIFFYCDHSTP
ncbi:hypothetical protein ACFL29_01160 [Patescibacteria group bacterium]